MECNKDDAARAMSIAEARLEKNDIVGAKKFAMKAQTLYPKHDGISKMVTNLDVYISAEKRINGKVNWYGVLGAARTVDEETIKKQYQKLDLMLHPDKNSAGVDGAFKLISEASSLLLDKEKRSAYDLIMGLKGPTPSNVYPCRPSNPTGSSITGPGVSCRTSSEKTFSSKTTKRKPSAPKPQKKADNAPWKPSPVPANQKV